MSRTVVVSHAIVLPPTRRKRARTRAGGGVPRPEEVPNVAIRAGARLCVVVVRARRRVRRRGGKKITSRIVRDGLRRKYCARYAPGWSRHGFQLLLLLSFVFASTNSHRVVRALVDAIFFLSITSLRHVSFEFRKRKLHP